MRMKLPAARRPECARADQYELVINLNTAKAPPRFRKKDVLRLRKKDVLQVLQQKRRPQ